MTLLLVACAMVGLSACEEVVSRQEGSFTYLGETYPTVTQTFERNGTRYTRMRIHIGAQRVTCNPKNLKSCETIVYETRYRVRLF